jgi:hypothetical protein
MSFMNVSEESEPWIVFRGYSCAAMGASGFTVLAQPLSQVKPHTLDMRRFREVACLLSRAEDIAMSASTISSHPKILGETPCFTGTRVLVKSLFDYLARSRRQSR